MNTLKSSFRYPWLIALSLALFSCAQTSVERDASNENGATAARSDEERSYEWWRTPSWARHHLDD